MTTRPVLQVVMTPESSILEFISYDRANHLLTVRLKNAKEYKYKNVTPALMRRFASADSVGRFWNVNIKGNKALL